MSGSALPGDLLRELRRRLADRPELSIEEREDVVEVAPPRVDGFPVALAREGEGEDERFVVYYGGWHQRYAAWREALHAFVYGLRGDCRLRVSLRGDVPVRWTLEHRRDGRWIPESSKSAWSLALWRPRGERLLRNAPGDP